MHPSAAHFASRWRIRLGKRVLFAIDEMPTVGLPNLTGYRATVGHAGITLVMYRPGPDAGRGRLRREAALSILSVCTSQPFFPPREPHTAELISRAFSSSLKVTHQTTFDSTSYDSRYEPEMDAAEVMSLPEGNLVVFSRGLRLIVQDSAMLSLAGCRECPRPQSWSCRT